MFREKPWHEEEEALFEAWRCIKAGDFGNADAILKTLPTRLGPAQNLRGVCQLQQGHHEAAVTTFRALVVPEGAVTIDASRPVAWQANFVVSLLLADNLDGFLAHVNRIQPQDHPLAVRLRETVASWREALSGWSKWRWKLFGGAPPVPLQFDFTPGFADEFLLSDGERWEARSPARPPATQPGVKVSVESLPAQPARPIGAQRGAPIAVETPETPQEAASSESDEAASKKRLKGARTIRVFVSSTFRDMVEERNELMTHVYPELRRICRERRVELVEVDLRWGITEEQSERGETLRLCLHEIQKCRPYFIGLLGERYGWVPGEEAFTGDLCEEQPWVEHLRDRSVTELEIVHGVLKNPEMAGRAFFYFRDPAYARKRGADFLSDSPASSDRQAELKKRIRDVCRKQHIPLRENYADPRALAAQVLRDLKEALYEDLPRETKVDALAWDALDHEAFAQSRCKTYIGRPEYFERLEAYAAAKDDARGLVVLGESGLGKSALLANWIATWREKHPQDFIFQHYIGSTPQSAGHLSLVRRLMREIQRWCSDSPQASAHQGLLQRSEDAIPVDSREMIAQLPAWLARASFRARQKRARFVIILDALNQLEDREQARLLGWLPRHLPEWVRLVVSTLPGDTLNALRDRAWPSLRVEPLSLDERKRLTVEYLARFGRRLDAGRTQRIAASPAAANPLYLKVLLDELRVTGTHEQLDRHIEDYLKAKDVAVLYDRVLARFERDYDQDRPGLVRDALSLIWAARRGLTEPELLDLLGPRGAERLPAAVWTRLRFGLEEGLVERSGILNFAHDYLRAAVEQRFVKNDKTARQLRLCLAEYFEGRHPDPRQAEELPWLLREAGERERLRRCLLDIDRAIALIEQDMIELLGYWLWLGQERAMGPPYLDAFERWEDSNREIVDQGYVANQIGSFLNFCGLYELSEPLYRRALESREHVLGPEHPDTLGSVNNLATLLHSKGDYGAAEPLFRRALESSEPVLGPDHPDTLRSVNNLALLLDSKGDYGAAEPLFRRALESSERVLGPDHPNTVGSVNNLAALLHSKGAYGEAEPLHRKALESSERVLGPDHPYTLTSLNNLAALLHSKGAYGEAEPFFQRALESYERVLGPDHPYTLTSLNNLAFLLSSKGAYGEAEPLFRRALESCERVLGSEHPDTLSTVNNLARLLESKGDYGEAETLYRRAMEARERVLGPEHPSTLTSVNNLADLLEKQGKLEESNAYQRRFILVQSKNPDLSPLELRTLALDCYKMGDYSRAKELLNRVQEHQFELPSTHCHLARIGILSGREGEARDHAKKAWEYRSEAQPYVLPRILWLQLALAFLQNSRCKSSDPIPQELLGRLKAALQSPDAHVEWSMDPVLAHLKPKLPPEVHELLTALVAALSDRAKLADLDRFPAWRAAKPIRD